METYEIFIDNRDDKSDSSSVYLEKPKKYELSINLKKKLRDLPEVLEFITKLQDYIEKQKKKLTKLKKKKHKEKSKTKNVSTQTEIFIEEEGKSITEQITEAAQQAVQTNGFVYDETSGMYYDYNSGYYYNAEYGLYYDGHTGTYLKYNQETKEYEFHSQVEVPKNGDQPKPERTKKPKRKGDSSKEKSHVIKNSTCNVEGVMQSFSHMSLSAMSRQVQDFAKQYPPCMRIIVEETNVQNFKQGSLHLITYEGGTLGREGTHAILIPDINISKYHLVFTFDKENNKYMVKDVGSRNGTYLNGKRLAPSKMESDASEVVHGSRLQIGGTTLLCHVHAGTQTCGHCEPGLVQIKNDTETVKTIKTKDHKEQLKILRKKFGLAQADQGKVIPGDGYTDRAQVRRETVGSQNPHEKTKVASLTESIDSGNKGFKMLAKMGWKEGQALGKESQGRLEPVELVSNPGTSGVGNQSIPLTVNVSKESKKNSKIWQKTQERYNLIPEQTEDIFDM